MGGRECGGRAWWREQGALEARADEPERARRATGPAAKALDADGANERLNVPMTAACPVLVAPRVLLHEARHRCLLLIILFAASAAREQPRRFRRVEPCCEACCHIGLDDVAAACMAKFGAVLGQYRHARILDDEP